MIRRLARLAVALAALLVLLPHPAPAQPALTTLRLAAVPVDDVMPVLYAQKAGLFTKAGLHVEITPMGGGAIPSAVVSGALDLGKGSIVSILNAHARGVPLVLVAPAALYDPRNPDAVLCVNADAALASPRDFIGKTVAISTLGEISHIAMQAWLTQNGVDWKQVQFLETTVPQMVQSLDERRVQAAVLIKPFITDAISAGKAKEVARVYDAIGPRFLESGWYANRNFAASHRDAIAAFQRVYAEASAYANAHPDQTAELLAAFTKISPERAAKVPRIVTSTALNPVEVQPVIDAMVKNKFLEKPFGARDVLWQ